MFDTHICSFFVGVLLLHFHSFCYWNPTHEMCQYTYPSHTCNVSQATRQPILASTLHSFELIEAKSNDGKSNQKTISPTAQRREYTNIN